MYCDRDFDLELESSPVQEDLIQDLELNILINAMSLGDEYIFLACKRRRGHEQRKTG
ncbi:hypothetical protein [Syntrophomonas palmitatica]|uniref:hypothetical protein n=1 Tax=Syntrophomonas palmitatica TaxID=402877 RepID=UPI0012ED460E|nr:hypothetical protein [Syntrophomonas palmitatica]